MYLTYAFEMNIRASQIRRRRPNVSLDLFNVSLGRSVFAIGTIFSILRTSRFKNDKLFKSFSLKSVNFERSYRIFKTNKLLSIKHKLVYNTSF